MNTDQDIASVVAQFVPIKLDTGTAEWRKWEQEHPSEGNGIPKIYVVRADGNTLYAKSGSLRGDALPNMMVQALSRSGNVLSENDARKLSESAAQVTELKEAGDISEAIKVLGRLKKYGQPGQIESYAESASRLNKFVADWVTEVNESLSQLAGQIRNGEDEQKLEAILEFYQLRRDFTKLSPLKPALSKFTKQLINHRDYRQLAKEAKVIETARAAKSESSKARSQTKLQALIDESEFQAVKKLAQKTIDQLNAKSD